MKKVMVTVSVGILSFATLCAQTGKTPLLTLAHYPFPSLESENHHSSSRPGPFRIEFEKGAGTTKTSGGSVFAKSTAVAGTSEEPGDQKTALSHGQYFSFEITPKPGFKLKLSSLDFQVLLDAKGRYDFPPEATWFVKTSVGGFDKKSPSFGIRSSPVSQSDRDFEPIEPAFDLSELPVLTRPVEIRIYLYDNQHSSGIFHRIDEVILKGYSRRFAGAIPAHLR
jgi:hypothetical protein